MVEAVQREDFLELVHLVKSILKVYKYLIENKSEGFLNQRATVIEEGINVFRGH